MNLLEMVIKTTRNMRVDPGSLLHQRVFLFKNVVPACRSCICVHFLSSYCDVKSRFVHVFNVQGSCYPSDVLWIFFSLA